MLKYRRLTNEELKEMEKEFVRFLAANTITSTEWTDLKMKDLARAEQLIEIFSNVVLEKVLGRVQFIEQRSKTDLRLFRFLDEKIELIGLTAAPVEGLDFTAQQPTNEMLELVRKAPKGAVKLYRAEKKYTKDPHLERFEMLEKGAFISDGVLFETLQKLTD